MRPTCKRLQRGRTSSIEGVGGHGSGACKRENIGRRAGSAGRRPGQVPPPSPCPKPTGWVDAVVRQARGGQARQGAAQAVARDLQVALGAGAKRLELGNELGIDLGQIRPDACTSTSTGKKQRRHVHLTPACVSRGAPLPRATLRGASAAFGRAQRGTARRCRPRPRTLVHAHGLASQGDIRQINLRAAKGQEEEARVTKEATWTHPRPKGQGCQGSQPARGFYYAIQPQLHDASRSCAFAAPTCSSW